jgi:hypothetical protein
MFDINIPEDVTKTAKDAAYVAVGLGVMTFQRAQVRRRELVELARRELPAIEGQLSEVRAELGRRVKDIDGRIDEITSRVQHQLQPVEDRLPAPAQAVLGQARDAGSQLRRYIVSAIAA